MRVAFQLVAQTQFARLFLAHLSANNMSQADFVRAVGCSKGWPSNILSGRHKPPSNEQELERWGKALSLNGESLEVFIEAALLEHTPERIKERYLKMKHGETSSRKRSSS
jgi:hypothetical protein